MLDSTEITEVEDKDIGTLLSHARDSIVEADNKACGAMLVQDLAGEIKDMCCQEAQRNRNVFCFRSDCSIVHRNGGASPVTLLPSSMVIIKNLDKLHAFISPMGSADKIDENALS